MGRGTGDGQVVAVDGPAGSGKSTVARRVAVALGAAYLDTGAMYRALTWAVLRAGVDPQDPTAVTELARRTPLQVDTDPQAPGVSVASQRLREEIRSPEVAAAVSAVSAVPAVRALLVAQQQALLAGGPAVAEGRDIGTVVAPAAPVKVFLTADAQTRARRRAAESSGGASLPEVAAAMARRDQLDSTRATDPLQPAADAVELDTTDLGVDDVVEAVLALCRARGLAPVGGR